MSVFAACFFALDNDFFGRFVHLYYFVKFDFYFVFIEIELIGFRVAFDKNGRGCVYRTSGRSCNVGT